MNIIEAMKSGKPFKRRGWDDYIFIDDAYFLKNPDSLKKEFLLADDWEVQEPQCTISQKEFWQAVVQAQQSGDAKTLVFRLAKLLGLE